MPAASAAFSAFPTFFDVRGVQRLMTLQRLAHCLFQMSIEKLCDLRVPLPKHAVDAEIEIGFISSNNARAWL